MGDIYYVLCSIKLAG